MLQPIPVHTNVLVSLTPELLLDLTPELLLDLTFQILIFQR